MDIKIISQRNRQQVNEFVKAHWFSTEMVVRGELVDMTKMDGFLMCDDEAIIGLVTYRIKENECEIMSLDSTVERHGIGSILMDKVIETARKEKCIKIRVVTTNDNIDALRFYQRRGFDMMRLYHNSLDAARRLKPSIPAAGNFNIPIKHEIELEMEL